MFNNGLPGPAAILGGMSTSEAVAAFRRHRTATDARNASGDSGATHPDMMGYGMVLAARGNVYGDVRNVPYATVQRRRARNKAARKARRVNR